MMIRRVLALTLVVALAFGMSGCIVRRASETDTTTESREVDEFSAVDFSGFGNIQVVQGDEYGLQLSGPTDLVDRIETEVRGDTLYIDRDGSWEIWILGMGNRQVDITITVPELKELKVEGAGLVNIDGLEGASFEFDLSGAGALEGKDLKLGELIVDMSGAGAATLSGQADVQKVAISGAGEYNAEELETRVTSVDMSGAGSADVWVTQTLDITADGAGTVNYWGDPDVRQEVSGAGTVHDQGDK